MKKIWHHLERTQEHRLEAEFKNLKIPFKKRLDVVWLILVFVLFSVFILWWLLGVIVGHKLGFFDPPPVQPIKDPRILINVRDHINENPLLDAVFHQPDGIVYISQQGGTIHGCNPSTGIWFSENTFLQDRLINPEIILLRSGCGTDPLSFSKSLGECWDTHSLWGLTANGGLVRRSRGKWEIVKSDSRFTGALGQPLTENQLTTAAVSPDHQWLVVGTQQDGSGIYHIKNREWLRVPEDFYKDLASREITHITWCSNRFWIGGPGGLASLQPDVQPARLQSSPMITGNILDMDVDFQGRLWVLEKKKCSSASMNCLRLSRFDFRYADQPPTTLVNETGLFSQLTFDDLHFAQYWENRLITAGSAGVYSYDTIQHNWERHFKGDVSVTLPFPGDNGFYFGYIGGIGVVSPGRHAPWKKKDKKCTTWLLPYPHVNEIIIQLQHGQSDEVLALSRSGKLFGIDVNGDKVSVLFQGERTGMDPRYFHSAVSFGDMVLFTGAKNALIHNIVTRTYRDIPINLLPDWLQSPGVQFVASGDQLYAAVNKKWSTHIYHISAKDASAGNFSKAVRLASLSGSVSQIRNWNNQGIGLIAGDPDDRVYRFHDQKEILTGTKVNDMNGVSLLDIAPYKDGIIAATGEGLRSYNYSTRTWGNYIRFYERSAPKEVVQYNNRVLLSTQNGRLLELTPLNKFENRIGSEAGFNMSDSQLSDIMVQDGFLYLAGKGWINCYDPELRRITDRWNLPGDGDIRIVAIIRGQPLTLTRGMAMIGTQKLDEFAGPVLNLSIDNDYIWTVRQMKKKGATYKYLKSYSRTDPLSASAQCYFYNPYTGGGVKKIQDAVELPNRSLAVSTDRGLYFYSLNARSWYESAPHQFSSGSVSRGGQLHLLGDSNGQLVRIFEEQNGFELAFTHLDTLQIPANCTTKPVIINEKTRKARAFALDPENERLAYITNNGAIVQWYGGVELEKLPPPGKEPLTNTLKRVFHYKTDPQQPNSGFLLFTTDDGILRYHLEKRYWSELPINIPLAGDILKDIDIGAQGRLAMITVKTGKGRLFLGSVDPATGNGTVPPVKMKPVPAPGTGFKLQADELLDVQLRRKNRWTFVLKDRIKYFNPVSRQWSPDIVIPDTAGTGAPLYCQVKDRGVIVMNTDQGPVWWVAREKGYHPVSFARYLHQPQTGEITALDNEGNIWRLLSDRKLYRLQQSLNGEYTLPQEPYEEPFLLNPRQVKAAFTWPGRVLFETADGLRMLDRIRRKEIRLSEEIRSITGIKEIVSDGFRLWIRTKAGTRLPFEEIPGEITIPDKIKDQWSQMKRHIVRLPDGQQVYDPITQLIIDNNHRLIAQRPGGESVLAQAAVFNPDTGNLPAALDVDWLRWDRNTRTFTIKTPVAVMNMAPDELIRDGKLIFAGIDALAAYSPNLLYAANRYGIWKYGQQDLSLNDPTIRFQPVTWPGPMGAAHGRFITPDGLYDTEGKRVSSSQENHRVTFGDVTLTEPIRETGVQGQIKRGSTYIDAFAGRGFHWDHQKRGLAYTSSDLLVYSDAGIHPVDSYTGFETPPGQGQLYSPGTDEIYFRSGRTWYRYEGRFNWKKDVPDPVDNRILVNNAIWEWKKHNGEVQIRLKSNPHGFKLISSAAGLAFTSDLLQDATSVGNQLMVMSDAFFETAAPANQLSQFQAARFPAHPTLHLLKMRDVAKGDNLVLYTGNQYLYWNDTNRQFAQSKRNDPPYDTRLLAKVPVDNPVLRFTRESSGKINKQLNVQHVSGTASWVPFNFWNQQFPFDAVTSIAARGQELYVGTMAGLQVYSGQPGTGIAKIAAMYQLRGAAGEPLAGVEKVGVPVSQPELVQAYSAGQCIEKPAGAATFRNCTNARRLNQRLRHQTGFWRFVDTNGKLEGRYAEANGQYSSEIISIKQGHFPHDYIKDIAIQEGQVFTLWHNGWISRYNSLSIELDQRGIVNYNMQSFQPQGFIIAERGLCLRGEGKRVWQYRASSSSWQEITDPAIVNGLLEYVQRPILQRKQLRLLSSGTNTSQSAPGPQPFVFEYRSRDGQWKPLPWRGDSLEIDRWTTFLYLDDKLWAATSLGLASFNIYRKGERPQVVIDPDSLVVISGPGKEQQALEITDIETHREGRRNIVTLRCDSNSELVFQGNLDNTLDSNVFQPLTGTGANKDPFASKLLISGEQTGFWEWRQEGNKDFFPGRLKATFHGEELQLAAGRFTFDSINSIAFFQEGQIEIGTDAGGWYRAPGGEFGDLPASSFQRPDVPGINVTLVKEVRSTLNPEGEIILGLKTGAEGFIRLGKQGISGKTRQFPQYLGSDGFWRYVKEDGEEKLSITAVKSTDSAQARRDMENGRFTDDIVLGLPVSGSDKQGGYYLVPTEAGILRLDEQLNPEQLHSKASLYPPDNPAPRVLYIDNHSESAQPLYMAEDGFHPLLAPKEINPLLKTYVPDGAVVLAVDDGPQDFVRLRWEKENQRGWTLMKPSDSKNSDLYSNTLYIHMKEFATFDEGSQPWIQVKFFPGHMEFLRHGSVSPFRVDYPEPLQVLAAMVKGNKLLLIGKTDLWEINLEYAMAESSK